MSSPLDNVNGDTQKPFPTAPSKIGKFCGHVFKKIMDIPGKMKNLFQSIFAHIGTAMKKLFCCSRSGASKSTQESHTGLSGSKTEVKIEDAPEEEIPST